MAFVLFPKQDVFTFLILFKLLHVERLGFRYGSRPIFDDLNFLLNKGELCAILGLNGSGKSTLFKCLLGFLTSYEGTIRSQGQDIRQLSTSEMAKRMAYVPQEHSVTFPYSVREMVLMGRTSHMNGFFKISELHYQKTEEVLRMLGLEAQAEAPFSQLSGGQRQMVLIARALAQETPLILLDEPTSSLDFKNQLLTWRILTDLKKQGKALLVCTHDPNHVLWFCDRVLIVHEQRLLADGPPQEVLNDSTLRQLYGPICKINRVDEGQVLVPNMETIIR